MRHQDRRAARGALLVLMGLFVASCRPSALQGVVSGLRFEVDQPSHTRNTNAATLVFDQVYADSVDRTRTVSVINDGIASLEVTWVGLEQPFSVDLPATLPPGATSLTIHYTPQAGGTFIQQLQVRSVGIDGAALSVQARALSIPNCTASSDCKVAHFDLALSKCVEDNAADEASCDPGTKCLQNPRCQTGRCVGEPVVCNDHDACTVDVCQAELGCEFLPAPPCPGDGACQVGVCHPESGCGFAPATDGTRCGTLQSCKAADVCIEGACVTRDPPDGYVCEEASPCNDEGRCTNDVCVHASGGPKLLSPQWNFDSAATADLDAGVQAAQYHDFVLEPEGSLSIGGFFNSPAVLRANTSPVAAPEGTSRRCILWNGRLVCADYPASPNGRVSAMDLATGAKVWSFDIHTARPDFVALTTQIFLARLVVQGSDRLAALFESYPKNPTVPGSSQCRAYFVAVINASGQLVMAQHVVDPLLDLCNHPHPYGVASDSIGNLYIGFSPTHSQQAPLVPDAPTMIVSYTHDGLFRWKRTEANLRGGELAVARGLLYPENSPVVLNAPTGEPAYELPSNLGRAVISNARLIPAPVSSGNVLMGYEAGQTMQRWAHLLPAGWSFWGEQLRLASWKTSRGPRSVALTFVTDTNSRHLLYGVDVQNGLQAFGCEVMLPQRTEPQLFEVANGKIAVMEGALDLEGKPGCLKCDPPLAGSSAAFQVLETPGLSIPSEPWIGTFGGAGHDHQEDQQ